MGLLHAGRGPAGFTDKTPDEYAAYYASLPFLQRLAFVVAHASLHNLSDAGRLICERTCSRFIAIASRRKW